MRARLGPKGAKYAVARKMLVIYATWSQINNHLTLNYLNKSKKRTIRKG